MKKRSKLVRGRYLARISHLVLSVSTSLAWYASARILHLDTVKVTIDSDRELRISTKEDSGYKSSLNDSDLNQRDLFQPVSSMGYGTLFDDQSSSPLFYQNYSGLTDTHTGIPFTPGVAERGFYQQELYLKADDDVYVTLDPKKCSFLPDEKKNRERAKERYPDRSDDELAKLVSRRNTLNKALRVSLFVPSLTEKEKNRYPNIRSFSVIDPYKDGTTLFGGILDTGYDGYYDDYEYTGDDDGRRKKGQRYETLYGNVSMREKAVYSDIMDKDIESDGKKNYDYSSFDSLHKQGVHLLDLEASRSNGRIIEKENSISLSSLGGKDSLWILPLYRNQPRKIILSLYREGWDRDCINQTRGASFLSSISFEIARER